MTTKTSVGYLNTKRDTPEKFLNSAPGSRVLIVASGSSTSKILPHRKDLKKWFDKVICINYSFKDFDEVADYHIVSEVQKSTDQLTVAVALDEKEYNVDIPRLVNWNGMELYDKKYNLHKMTRSNFSFKPDIRKYKHNGSEGLLYWTPKCKGWSSGTSSLSAMHFATIIGADEIYLIGVDLYFKDEFDHYYGDKVYRNANYVKNLKPKYRIDIVKTRFNDKTVQTTELFRDSAETINEVIPTIFKDVKVFDFSDGLITAATQLDIDDFVKE